jgi:mannose-6-phosphate isomerase-like protein (cupin superfamily)
VLKGTVSFVFPDYDETFEAGDAYYVPPGHVPLHHAGAEIVEFSPTDILEQTIKVVMSNLQRGGGAS